MMPHSCQCLTSLTPNLSSFVLSFVFARLRARRSSLFSFLCKIFSARNEGNTKRQTTVVACLFPHIFPRAVFPDFFFLSHFSSWQSHDSLRRVSGESQDTLRAVTIVSRGSLMTYLRASKRTSEEMIIKSRGRDQMTRITFEDNCLCLKSLEVTWSSTCKGW